MYRALHVPMDGKLKTDLQLVDIAFALHEPDGLLWVDFLRQDNNDGDEEILAKTFGFHPLAIDDALRETHVPKLDNWGKYLYLVFHAVNLVCLDGLDLSALELDIFLGKNFIVTHHDKPLEALDRLWLSIQKDERSLKFGPDHLLYRIVDDLVGSYISVFDTLDNEIDQLESLVFGRQSPDTLERIYNVKRIVLHLRRIIFPQREVLHKLSREEFEVVDARAQVYFRDVYDHLVRLHDLTESMRDLVTGTLETYLSIVNNRMNEVVKVLTVITTFFMPLSFITSFFGMNFFNARDPLHSWTEEWIFILVILLMFSTPIFMLGWLRKRGWM